LRRWSTPPGAAEGGVAELDVERLLGRLTGHGVDYVVVGGIAAVLWGSPRNTFDLDVCPAIDQGNLEALAKALIELEARLRDIEEDVPFSPDARALANVEILTLDTIAGPLDLIMRPSGAPAYERLRKRATRVDVGAFSVLVASIDDLIAMKRTTGRLKDEVDAEELDAIQRLSRRLDRRSDRT
jgi:uncharacterized nucleotidyltransferase DUF6036